MNASTSISESPNPSAIRFGLEGRVALITGGAQGIGEACARRLVREGARVVILDVADALGRQLAIELGADYIRCDVSDSVDVQAAVARAVERHGRIDILVNNAGIFKAADFLEVTEEDFDAVLGVNLKGSFLMGQAVARQMVAQGGGGAIVNMASILGSVGFANAAAYTASKHGVVGLTRVAALEYSSRNVRVNAIGPGFIETPMTAPIRSTDEGREMITAQHPIGRLGRPEEIADLALFLCSGAASFITGAYYVDDGGYTAR